MYLNTYMYINCINNNIIYKYIHNDIHQQFLIKTLLKKQLLLYTFNIFKSLQGQVMRNFVLYC